MLANDTANFTQCDFTSVGSKMDAFIFIFISIASLIGHIVIFVAYSSQRILRNTTNVFLISLSASDVIVAVFAVPFSFGVFLCKILPEEDNSTTYNYLYRYVDMLSNVVSIYSLSLISIDRATAVSMPFFYRKHMNRKVASVTVVIMWLLISAALFLQLELTKRDFTVLSIIMAYAIPIAVMVFSYIVIGYVAKKHAKEINQLERTATRLNGPKNKTQIYGSHPGAERNSKKEARPLKSDATPAAPLTQQESKQKSTSWRQSARRVSQKCANINLRCLWREIKCAVKLSFILLCFVTTWTPFMVLNMKEYKCNFCGNVSIDEVKYFKLLHYFNSALNPLLYILLNKTWKRAFKSTVCCEKSIKERQSTYTSSATSR